MRRTTADVQTDMAEEREVCPGLVQQYHLHLHTQHSAAGVSDIAVIPDFRI